MLYLEDYLEMIENLPMELRDRFTEMRELDLQVQNTMDSLEEKVKKFFEKCGTAPTLKQEWKDEQMKKIKQEYTKIVEDADEKIQLANQLCEMVERYLRKLEQELAKFKLELEADNGGITEVIEKRFIESEQQTHNNHIRGEKRKHANTTTAHTGEKRLATEGRSRSLVPLLTSEPQSVLKTSATATFPSVASTKSVVPYGLGPMGAGSSSAIHLAATQAIGATLNMAQGRRTEALKASYAASLAGSALNRSQSSASMDSLASLSRPATPSQKGPRKRAPKAGQLDLSQSQLAQQLTQPSTPIALGNEPIDVGVEDSSSSWQVDPNEPRYCICNDVSYGDMVGCDNSDCPIEWFHYGCVGLNAAPRGKWYCPQCTVNMKRRGGRR